MTNGQKRLKIEYLEIFECQLKELRRVENILRAKFHLLLGVALIVCQLGITMQAVAAPWPGSGTAETPYELYDANDIQAIGADPNFWDAHFRLCSDVNMGAYTGTAYNIIGNNMIAFTGVFDGNGHSINGFAYYQTGSENDIGIFGFVDDACAVIKDIMLIAPGVNAGYGNNVGALIGTMKSGLVLNCGVKGGFVSGDHSVGGLIGRATSTEIYNCRSSAAVTGTGFFTGGLASSAAACQVFNSYSLGTVNANEYVGGLLGLASSGTLTSNCYSAASVSANEFVGALVGRHWDTITSYNKCFWDSTINPSLDGIGNRTDPEVVGLPTAGMKQMDTFTDAGWDFVGESTNGSEDIWSICEVTNYPRFVWEIPRIDFVCPDGVSMPDYSAFASAWLSEPNDPGWNPACDISEPSDGVIDELDLVIFLPRWLTDLE